MAAAILPLFVAMAGFAGTTLGVSFLGRFIPYALMYHAVVFGFFWVLYMAIGFGKHFNLPKVNSDSKYKDYKGDGPLDVLYYTAILHSTTGFGDVYPLTWQARVLVIMHVTLVFLATANMLPIALPSGPRK